MKLALRTTAIAISFMILAVFSCCIIILSFVRRSTTENATSIGTLNHQHFMSEFRDSFYEKADTISDQSLKSYLVYTFEHCQGSDEFSIQNNTEVIVNNTGIDSYAALDQAQSYELTDSYTVIKRRIVQLNNQYFLLIGQTWSYHNIDYLVTLTRDITSAMDEVNYLARKTFTITVVVAFITAIFIVLFEYKSFQPLKKLNKGVQRIARSSYSERIILKSNDEIGELACSINQMAASIETQIRTIEATSEERQFLLAALSHEMRTPITTITGYSHALLKAKLTESQKQEAVEYIDSECRRLERLTTSLSRLVLLQGVNIQLTSVPCRTIEKKLRYLLVPPAEKNGISVDIQSSDETMDAEEELILCLITNLFDNARKARASQVEIRISAAKISVSDNGRGIPEDQISKIVKPFYKLDESRSSEGIGLGLTLVQKIADIHHSELIIQSQEDAGTTIIVNKK